MKIKASEKTKNIVYAIRNIVSCAKELEKKGKKITYLNIGDPIAYDFETPKHLCDAVARYMRQGVNGYAPSYGLEEARLAIVEDELKKGKKHIDISKVLVCSGASEAIEIALTALLDPTDNILLPVPGYPLYSAVVSKLNTNFKGYRLNENNNWQIDLNDIEELIDDNTRAIVIINPNNPTGVYYNKKTLEGIIELCERHNLIMFSDEIYDKMLYDDFKMIYPSQLSSTVPIVSFNGLSKNYMAPGWRMGWMVFQNMDEQDVYISAIKKIAEARLCSPSPLQGAIPAALQGSQAHISSMLKKLQKRRDITFERLNAIERVSSIKAQATFYAMAKVEGVSDDEKFVKDFLNKTGVLFVHGSGFGLKSDEGMFRVVFLPDEKTLHFAYDQLENFLKTNY